MPDSGERAAARADFVVAGFGDFDFAIADVDGVIRVGFERRNDFLGDGDDVAEGFVFARGGNNERRDGFVYENAVGFVHDGGMHPAEDEIFGAAGAVVKEMANEAAGWVAECADLQAVAEIKFAGDEGLLN